MQLVLPERWRRCDSGVKAAGIREILADANLTQQRLPFGFIENQFHFLFVAGKRVERYTPHIYHTVKDAALGTEVVYALQRYACGVLERKTMSVYQAVSFDMIFPEVIFQECYSG